MKWLKPYRYPLLLLLLGYLLLGQSAYAQSGSRSERTLQTEKQKKKPKKKKRKDPDHSHRDRVQGVRQEPKDAKLKPGDFSSESPVPGRDDYYRPQLNDGKKIFNRPASRGTASEPGTHYSERSSKLRKKATAANGTNHQGRFALKEKDIDKPGQVYNEEERLKASRRRKQTGHNHEGNIPVRRKDIHEPGQVYQQEERQKALRGKKLQGTMDQGSYKVKKSEMLVPGTHHAERNLKAGQRYSSYNATRYAGNGTVKTKWVREPGQHWSERKSSFARQYNSTAAAIHPGTIRGKSKQEKARYYRRLSEKAHQYRGEIKLSKREADMHPSAAARKALTMRSQEQKNNARNRSRWLNRIFKDKDQPKSVKAKDRKPRHDKEERDICYD